MKLTSKKALGITGLQVPQVVYGTSYLGNLYRALPYEHKLALMRKWFECTEKPVVIDTAGKYGAGLALEVIGRGLADLRVDPQDIIISNKLGWYRVPLETREPTFEPGAWAGIQHDCIQMFGYEGIMKCFEQGNELLGGTCRANLVSVHDPDEYLLAAADPADRNRRFLEILESYRALFDLKQEGKVKAVGIGSKSWRIIRELYEHVPFDWVMLANSFTIFSHPEELLRFMDQLAENGVGIINSAVFHGGFLTGGEKFDYRDVDAGSDEGRIIFAWRAAFNELCAAHKVVPGDACLHFGLSHPAVAAIALNTSSPEKMARNVETLNRTIPAPFWKALKEAGVIDAGYRYV
ncbi:MAG: aldo/keto reductase [Bacteroidales bacterium]|nr:aldo/keto reductase [Bacteroidales bacterium]